MNLPISKRLLCCASLVPEGARVADIGCDHGYLGIHLLIQGIASYVAASDLRPLPLQTAKDNAAAFGTSDRMDFFVADGLSAISPGSVNTIVCAGMGGDNIADILDAAPWVRTPDCTLILQPNTSGNHLRKYLGDHGFSIRREVLVKDGNFLYFTLAAVFGGGVPLTPGQQYVSPALLAEPSYLLPEYFDRVCKGLQQALEGIGKSKKDADRQRLPYYQSALNEVLEMRKQYDRA